MSLPNLVSKLPQVPLTVDYDAPEDLFADVFARVSPVDPFTFQKDQVATDLAALLSYSNKTRLDLIESLGWKKSRISTVLSGKGNLTLKTLHEFTSDLGYEFDVVFRSPDTPLPMQPWQRQEQKTAISYVTYDGLGPRIEVQSAAQVANDIHTGNHKDCYFSLYESIQPESFEPKKLEKIKSMTIGATLIDIGTAV